MPTVEETAAIELRRRANAGAVPEDPRPGPMDLAWTAVKSGYWRWRTGTAWQRVGIWSLTVLGVISVIAVALFAMYLLIAMLALLATLFVAWWALSAAVLTPSARERSLRRVTGRGRGRR